MTKVEFQSEIRDLKESLDAKFEAIMAMMMENRSPKESASGVRHPEAEKANSATETVAEERPTIDDEVLSQFSDSGESKQLEIADQFKTPGLFVGDRKKPSRKESGLFIDDEQRRLASLEAKGFSSERTIARVIQSEDFNKVMSKLDWRAYMTHRRDIQIFQERNAYGVGVNLLASLGQNVRGIILNDCRTRNAMGITFKRLGTNFPESAEEMVRLDFSSLDALIRLSMRPPNKVEFLAVLQRNVNFWLPEGFKPGLLNFTTQYHSYQNFTEDFRKLYCWMSFDGEPEWEASLLPEVDSKDKSLVKCYKKLLPEELAEHFFTLLPKRDKKEKYWKNFPEFLTAMDQVWHSAYTSYRSNVIPFINLYHGAQQQHRGGVLKTLSEYFAESEEILDGDPFVVSAEDPERIDAIFSALHAFGGDPHKIPKHAEQLKKTEQFPCIKTIMQGSCPDRASCKFSHDPAALRAKAAAMHRDLIKSPFFSAAGASTFEEEEG